MPTLHALLVSIDHYPNPSHILHGCVNDGIHMHQYLESYCESMSFAFRPLVLCDAEATRQAVIDGFNHFQAAKQDDCCLFFYSGHGSRSDAPEAFKEYEPDKMLESMVCYDSRQPGGNDLMDKELSYLIWQASKSTKLPFVSLMDCCHSGRMRDIEKEILGIRNLRDVGPALPAEHFIGIEHYQKTKSGHLSPPLGRRVHLAAARDTELAKEVTAGGKPRGIFTYCLIEALKENGPLISYADLINRVNPRIKNNVKDQSAQLDATHSEDRNLGFLFTKIEAERPSYLVSWDKELGWLLNAGALHGITGGSTESPTLVEIKENGHKIEVESVLTDRTKVSGMDGYDTKRSFVVNIMQMERPKLNVAFAPDSDPRVVELLSLLSRVYNSPFVQLQDTAAKADYIIHADQNAFILSRKNDPRPLFQTSQVYDEAAAKTFLRNVAKVATWHQILALSNPRTSIRDAEISLELFQMKEARGDHEMGNDVPMALVDWQVHPVVFSYFEKNMKPAFQLKLRNTGFRPLWVSVLYLGSDFSITNQLLAKGLLGAGQETWVQEVLKNGQSFRTIPLRIEETQNREGNTFVDEYIKVIISTEELNTDFYNQVRTPIEHEVGGTRLAGRGEIPVEKDWTTKTIWLRVERV
ncbi:MAG: caspase family protein [Saprospiraceae bacterium]|nr:caspase family protein [Saprospiraceae bacterium]